MKIVLDANVIIAALLGSRATIIILTSQNHTFYAPLKIVQEIYKYKEFILERTKQPSEEFDITFSALLKFIIVLELAEYSMYLQRAQKVLAQRDIKDADYLACAFVVNADFIWTNDKDFSQQKIVLTKTTQEFIDEGK